MTERTWQNLWTGIFILIISAVVLFVEVYCRW